MNAKEDRQIKKDANAILAKIHGSTGRDLGHITREDNDNYRVRKSDGERAIAALHRTADTGVSRVIRKVARPQDNDAAAAIARMHSDPAEFADRDVAGNGRLVAKLAGAIAQVIKRDFTSAKQAKAAIRKLIED